jgi:membrane protein YqaA with SNARE-associated domain
MTAALLSVLAVSALSAFLPLTPVEPYLVVLAADGQPALLVGLAAAVGQTAGKVLIFSATRATVRSGPVQRWVARRYKRPPGRVRKLLDRPALVAPTVFASAVTGLPPLLAVSVHAARTPVPTPVFALCCLAGRAVRFVAVMMVPGLL